MKFSHLPYEAIEQIVSSYQKYLPLYDTTTRSSLCSGISPRYLGILPSGLPPNFQLLSDLNRFNELERLNDGSVPLLMWLKNVALLSSGTELEKIVLKAIDEISHRVSGEPRVETKEILVKDEVVIHQDDMVSYAFMAAGLRVAKGVAKLMVERHENGQPKLNSENDPIIYLGTGWLLSPELLITNHHVINARNENEPAASRQDLELQSKSMRVIFDFDDDKLEGTKTTVISLEAFSENLDYALVRLPPTSRLPLAVAGEAISKRAGDYIPVNIVQHPGGSSKKYAIRNNLVTQVTETDLVYFTDTKSGSSGSPVFDDKWKVVALHRGSTYTDQVSFQGRPTAWVNLGTRIHSILSDLKTRFPKLELPAIQ